MDLEHLEINLISAQNLMKPGATNLRRMQTYALAWVDPSTKLRTRLDRIGGENPTWNDKFIFRVAPRFLSSDSSAVSIEIYALGLISDTLVGTVRFLAGSHLVSGVPSFSALLIRRPSGRCHGVLNIAAVLLTEPLHAAFLGSPAIGYQDLMGRVPKTVRRARNGPKPTATEECSSKSSGEYCDSDDYSDGISDKNGGSNEISDKNDGSDKAFDKNSGAGGISENNGDFDELSDETDSGGALKDLNGRTLRSIFCGLGFQRKIHHMVPSIENLCRSASSDEIRR